jgi:peptidoglycan/LPS O-acetylase OafA/YrhL
MARPVDKTLGPAWPGQSGEYAISKPRLENRRQIPALTGLRFFAAFFILFAHACNWLAPFQNSNIGTYFSFVAMYGMPLFFVLSGFVIHYNYRDLFAKAGWGRAICEFGAARFARLYPLYACLLVVALAADSFFHNNYGMTKTALSILGWFLTLTQSWLYLVYDGKLIIHQLFPLSWSISTEMFFYLAYAVLLFAVLAVFRRFRRPMLICVLYAFVVFTTLLYAYMNLGTILNFAARHVPDYIGNGPDGVPTDHSFVRWLLYFSPYGRVFEFFMGCFVAQAFMEWDSKPVSAAEHRYGVLAIWAAMACLAVAGLLVLRVFDLPLLNAYAGIFANNFLCAPAIAVLLFCTARYDTSFARWMSAPVLVALGETSYSIYLVHEWTLRIFVLGPEPFTRFWAVVAAFRIVVAIAFTLVVAYGTYRLIEVPGRSRVRGTLRRLIARAFDRVNPKDAKSGN